MAFIFQKGFVAASETLATTLLCLAQSETSSERSAEEIWANPLVLKGFTGELKERLTGLGEFIQGWVEYRRALLRLILLRQDFPEDIITAGAAELKASEFLTIVEKLRIEPSSARDLAILSHLATGLMKSSMMNSPSDVLDLIHKLLLLATR